MSSRIPEKSTIGRSISKLAPELAGRIGASLFKRPQRLPRPALLALPPEDHRFRIRVGDDHIAIREWGAGPTVVLVHGWSGQWDDLGAFVEPLLAARHHVVAFDLPAHGASAGGRAHVLDLADAVRAVLTRFAPVHAVIAHSLGATASVLAMTPGVRVGRAVLIAPPAEPAAFARAFAAKLGLAPAAIDAMLDTISRDLGRPLAELDLRGLVPALPVQALLLHDPADRVVPFDHGATIAAAWPGARLVPIERAGHTRILRDERAVGLALQWVISAADARPTVRAA